MKPCSNKLLGYSYIGLQKKASITQISFRKNLLDALISIATMKLSLKDFLLVLKNKFPSTKWFTKRLLPWQIWACINHILRSTIIFMTPLFSYDTSERVTRSEKILWFRLCKNSNVVQFLNKVSLWKEKLKQDTCIYV